MELERLHLTTCVINERAGLESNDGVAILLQHGEDFIETFSGMVKGIKSIFATNKTVEVIPNTYKSVATALSSVNYATIDNIAMPVPEGFKGNLIGYGEYLLESVQTCKLAVQLLDLVYKEVSVSLTNPERPQETLLPTLEKTANQAIDKAKKGAALFLNPNTSVSALPLSKVIRRSADWVDVVKIVNNLNDEVSRLNRKEVLDKAEKLDDLIGKLIKQRKNRPEFSVDTEWLKFVINHTYLCAEYMEFLAITHYRLLAYFHSVDGISQKLIAASGR